MDSPPGERGASRAMKKSETVKMLLRNACLAVAATAGTRLSASATGQPLGRAIVIAWRGKIHVIGMERTVRPMFLPQKRVTYWKQEIGFSKHPPPDFPSVWSKQADIKSDAR